jgi:hypothetical protein
MLRGRFAPIQIAPKVVRDSKGVVYTIVYNDNDATDATGWPLNHAQ